MVLTTAMRRFLAARRVAHLATADAQGQPHVVPVCFALAGDVLYIAIDRKPKRVDPHRLRRVRNLLANPRVAVTADVYREDWRRLGFVWLQGTARLLDAGAEYRRALDRLRRKYPQYRGMALHGRPVIAVDVVRAGAWGAVGATPGRAQPLSPPARSARRAAAPRSRGRPAAARGAAASRPGSRAPSAGARRARAPGRPRARRG
jgi:PPOX class probable F420-dependent enzyme